MPLGGLEIEWLGTAGFRLTAEGRRCSSPYVSRPGLRAVDLDTVLRPCDDLVEQHLPRADAVLDGHTHFDHALDVPVVAPRDGAPVYGSRRCANVLGLHGLADRAVEVTPPPHEIARVASPRRRGRRGVDARSAPAPTLRTAVAAR